MCTPQPALRGPRLAILRVATCLLLAGLLACATAAEAGGGPERTVVVVNADSPVSLQVAHAYARRRGIPAQNLVYLEGVP
ncbi:MAG: hypothetical protein ACKOSS_00800, partial [Planctomycetia bacterium]